MAYKIAAAALFGGIQSSPQLVRTSTGNLYAVLAGLSGTSRVQVYKSTDQGISWALQDYKNTPPTSGNTVAAVIDGNDTIHIIYKFTQAFYVSFSTGTDTFGNREKIFNETAGSSIAIAIDSNNIPHCFATGATATKLQYGNRIRGYFTPNSIITLSTTSGTVTNIDAQIDKNNCPIVSIVSGAGISVVTTTSNNPTAGTATTIADTASSTAAGGSSLAIDASGNTWLTYQAAQDGLIQLAKHIKTDAWSTWQTAVTNGFSGKTLSLVADPTSIYVFYERNAGGIAYDRYDTVNGKWLGEQILQANTSRSTTNTQYHNPFVKWSQYFNNGDTAANNTGQQTIEYLFDDGSTVYYDKLVTAQISTGYVNFQFSTSAVATTTSTSSTSSSISTSISTSSTSSSTSTSISTSSTSSSTSRSTSTSSTSQSTSISTSSTSSSISTSSTSQSTSISTSSTSQSTSVSTSISTSSTSSSTSISTSSTSSSISTSSTSSSTSRSTSTSSTSQSTSISTSISTSSTSQSTSISTSSTSSSTSISSTSSSTSLSTSSTSQSTSLSTSTSTTVSFTTSTSSTSASTSISTSSTSSSISTSISTSSTSRSTSTSITTSSTSASTSTSKSTSTSSTSQSTSTSKSTSTSSTSSSVSTSLSTTTTPPTTTSTSSTSSSTSTSTTLIDFNMLPRAIVRPYHHWTKVKPFRVITR